MELTRVGNEVWSGEQKLSINPQASKGPNNEVVNIAGVPGANGKKWMSLSRIKEGTHDYTAAAKTQTQARGQNQFVTPSYTLTTSEQDEVTRLEQLKQVIINKAIERTKFLSKLNDVTSIAEEDKDATMSRLEEILAELKKD